MNTEKKLMKIKIANNIFSILLGWLFFTSAIAVISCFSEIVFENLNIEKEIFLDSEAFSIYDLKKCYPRFWILGYLFKLLNKYNLIFTFLLSLIFFTFLYKKVISEYLQFKNIFFILLTTFYLCFLFEFLFSYIIDYKELIGIKFNSRSIGYDLKQMQTTYSDSLGINKILKISENLMSDYKINDDGFRSNHEFSKSYIDSLKKTSMVIMFIGDSHTEGCCAKPITASFVDLIDNKPEYTALNFGVGGTDPLQYRLIAENYIEKLKPDIVVIPFCIGNDFINYERMPKPFKPLHYQTNYNWLDATLPLSHPNYDKDSYFESWDEAKDFYIENYTILGNSSCNILKWFTSNSNFNSFIVYIPRLVKKIFYNTSQLFSNDKLNPLAYYIEIKKISDICIKNNISIYVIGVPTIKDMNLNQKEIALKYQANFFCIPFYYPVNLRKNDFLSENNDHFVNEGHIKFSNFILEILNTDSTSLPTQN